MQIFAVLMLVTSEEDGRWPFTPPNKRVVRIRNAMNGNVSSLLIHCKSGTEDMGVHKLAARQYFEWEFKQIPFTKMIYTCNIKWNETVKQIDAYSTARDKKRCKLKCWWRLRTDGGYAYNEQKEVYELLYPWKN